MSRLRTTTVRHIKMAWSTNNIFDTPKLVKRLIKQRIKFIENNREYIYDVEHNLPNIFGQSLQCAVDVWRTRTKDFSLQSLINYIDSKNQGVVIKELKK